MNNIERIVYKKLLIAFLIPLFTILTCIPTIAFGAEPDLYYIQVGSFKTEERAVRFSNELKQLDYDTVIRSTEISDSEFWNRVYIGPYSSRIEADSAALELRKKGYSISYLHFSQVYPIHDSTMEFLNKANKVIMVENNATGQFADQLYLKFGIKMTKKILKYTGVPFSMDELVVEIEKELK